MKSKKIVAAILCSGALASQAIACSVFYVPMYAKNSTNTSNVLGFRSLDFEEDLPTPAVYGDIGQINTSSIDVTAAAYNNAATWTNKYRFIGKRMSSNQLMDGVNSEGVYMGALYLPNVTQYPKYQATSLPTLSVFDMINYVLGTSGSVAEALTNLEQVEVDMGTIQQSATKRKVYPLHFMIIDKTGDSAVIEFLNGVMTVTTTGNLQVLTNSPEISFQQMNYDKLSQLFSNHNTDYQADGQYMNGSGYIGLPGDSMPPSRYSRIRALLAASPKAFSEAQANYVVNAVAYAGAIVPIGINPAPTYWSSSFNLNTGEYSIRNYITSGVNNKFLVTPSTSPYYLQTYNVNDVLTSGLQPIRIVQAQDSTIISYLKAKTLMATGTSSTTSYIGQFADDLNP